MHRSIIITLTVFLSFCNIVANAQHADNRAYIKGGIKDFYITPNGTAWLLSSAGYLYYKNAVDTTWHASTKMLSAEAEDNYNQVLDNVSFFNDSTAIITGYISKEEYGPTSYYYRTSDYGKSFDLLSFGGVSWIYCIDVNNKGQAWMGGHAKNLFYSADQGLTWNTIKMQYKSSDRTYDIFMLNSTVGIAGSERNEILTTKDGWKTVEHIATPLGKAHDEKQGLRFSDSRISKVGIWGNILVAKQGDKIYYTEAKNINWQVLSETADNFTIDKSNGSLYLITEDKELWLLRNLDDRKLISNEEFSLISGDMKVADNTVFILNNHSLYEVNEHLYRKTGPYTLETNIPTPDNIIEQGGLKIGVNNYNAGDIYYSINNGKDWYRDCTLDIGIRKFEFIRDSTLLIWDGENNYTYKLGEKQLHPYYLDAPITSFFDYPINRFIIKASSTGCFHYFVSEITYNKKGLYYYSENVRNSGSSDLKDYRFVNNISVYELKKLLEKINKNPHAAVDLKDFRITNEDIQAFKSTRHMHRKYILDVEDIAPESYYTVADYLDTISTATFSKMLNTPERMVSTNSNTFQVLFINDNNDILEFYSSYFMSPKPWHLPYEVRYKGLKFQSSSLGMASFINRCIPDKFEDKEFFDNKYLIRFIADYYYDERTQK